MSARLTRWILLSGNRYYVAIGILVFMTGIVLVPGLSRFAIQNITPVTYMASALITGNITLITIVVTINQVILSQELESPGSLRDEIERTAEYRQEALDRQTAPVEPSDFLQQLLQETRHHARAVEELLPESRDEAGDRLPLSLPRHCAEVSGQLDPPSDTLSNVIVPLLGVNYAGYIHGCHQLQARYDGTSHEELRAMLDQLAKDLENLDVARQYFTTAFMKEELATLSRSLLCIGIVSVSTPIALLFHLATYPEPFRPLPILPVFVFLTAVVGLVPLVVLIAFVLRIAAVAHYMASITPFQT